MQLVRMLKAILAVCKENDKKVITVESLTGGELASKLSAIPGSSSVFKIGIVTYSDEAKIKIGVPEETLKSTTAVSKQTAIEMAKAPVFLDNDSFDDFQLGITGEAGPVSATGKDIGTVYIAIRYPKDLQVTLPDSDDYDHLPAVEHINVFNRLEARGNFLIAEIKFYDLDRKRIRKYAVDTAIYILFKLITESNFQTKEKDTNGTLQPKSEN